MVAMKMVVEGDKLFNPQEKKETSEQLEKRLEAERRAAITAIGCNPDNHPKWMTADYILTVKEKARQDMQLDLQKTHAAYLVSREATKKEEQENWQAASDARIDAHRVQETLSRMKEEEREALKLLLLDNTDMDLVNLLRAGDGKAAIEFAKAKTK